MEEETFQKAYVGHTGGGLYNYDDFHAQITQSASDIGVIQGIIQNIDPANPTREFVTIYEDEPFGIMGSFSLSYVRSGDIFSFWGKFTTPTTTTVNSTDYFDFDVDVLDMYQGEPVSILSFNVDPQDAWGVNVIQFMQSKVRIFPWLWSYEPNTEFEFDKTLILWEEQE